MTDENRCEPPPEMRDVDGWHWLHKDCPVFWIADQGEWDWGNDEFLAPEHVPASYHYIGPVTPPATVSALVEALAWYALDYDHDKGCSQWDGGTKARQALALYRGEAGR